MQNSMRRSQIQPPSFEELKNQVENKIVEYETKIKQSHGQLDHYIFQINHRLQKTIQEKLSIFKKYHQRTIWQKNQQIKLLQKQLEDLKLSIKENESIQKLNNQLNFYREEALRVNSVMQMFKKQAERNKIDIGLIESQLIQSKKREKRMIKTIWILEENIKSIGQQKLRVAEENSFSLESKKISRLNSHISLQNISLGSGRAPERSLLKKTEKFQINKSRNQNINSKQRYIRSYRDSKSKQEYKRSNALQQDSILAKQSQNKYQKGRESSLRKNILILNEHANRGSEIDIYEELRNNLQSLQHFEIKQKGIKTAIQSNLLSLDQFKLILSQGSSIINLIKQVIIEEYGPLKKVDQESIQILTSLFNNINALKILEIILFNYSQKALSSIRQQNFAKNKKILKKQTIFSKEGIRTIVRHKTNKMEKQIRKKFKTQISQAKMDSIE